MKLKKVAVVLILPLMTVSAPFLSKANQTSIDTTIDARTRNMVIAKRLYDSSMEERNSALFEINEKIKTYPMTGEIKEQILRLAEDDRMNKEYAAKGELGEQYHSQLITALGNTKDPKAIPYLMGYLGGGTAVARSLYNIGEPAIDPLIKKLHDEVVGFRSSAAYALGLFLKQDGEGYIAKGEIREKIKQAFLKELKDPRNKEPEKSITWFEVRANERAGVRRIIVRGLGYLAETGDNDVLPFIKSAAEEDPYFLDMSKKKNYSGPQKKYLVREEAQKVLNGLKAKGIVK